MMLFPRVVVIAFAVLTAACGQKGPPLAPLHLVPSAPGGVAIKRVADEARLRFAVPSTNVNGPGPLALDHVEVYAATLAPGAARPSNKELFISRYRVGTIAVEPAPVEGEAEPDTAEPDPRPAAGERAAFVEPLTGDVLVPAFTKLPVVPPGDLVTRAAAKAGVAMAVALMGAAAQASAAALPPPAAAPTYPVRLYVVRGATSSGRPGPPSARMELPLVPPPAAPPAPVEDTTESAIVLTWLAPVTVPPLAFNVYKAGGIDPINSAPLVEPKFERAGVEFGTEECFVLRAVQTVGGVEIESESSAPACITPRDTFPPRAPTGVSVVAGPGLMNLSWDANKESDLAGYLVLRGEVPGGTLQPLTPSPISSTSYEDKTAAPGVRYAYVIVAVDKASPANSSAPSTRVEETAR